MCSFGNDWQIQCWFMTPFVHLFGSFFACPCLSLPMVLHSQHLYISSIWCVWPRYLSHPKNHSSLSCYRSCVCCNTSIFFWFSSVGYLHQVVDLLFRNHALLAVVPSLNPKPLRLSPSANDCDLGGGLSDYCTGWHIVDFRCWIGTIFTLIYDSC